MRWRFSPSRRHHRHLVLLFGLAAISLVLLAVWSNMATFRQFALFSDVQNWQSSLPVGWIGQAELALRIPEGDLDGVVVPVTRDGETAVAWLTWNRGRSVYDVLAIIPLTDIAADLKSVTGIRMWPLGAEAGLAVAVDVDTKQGLPVATFFLNRLPNAVAVVESVRANGLVAPAVFYYGYDVQSEITLHELTADNSGLTGVVNSGRLCETSGCFQSANVYVWRNGHLDFDKELSRLETESLTRSQTMSAPAVDKNPPKP